MKHNYDIIIIGGGLAGMTQAILLGQQGWRVACIDRDIPQNQINTDVRTTAISWGSRNLLKHAGVWPDLADKSQAIRDILILDENSPIDLEFNAGDVDAEGFGWIVDNRDLRGALINHMGKYNTITHITGQSVNAFDQSETHVTVTLHNGQTLTSKLVIGADGRNSFTRDSMGIGVWEHDYKTSAIVCLIHHDKPHDGMALEHFRSQGPFAVLPFTDDAKGHHRSAVVWSVPTDEAKQWMATSDDILTIALQERCGNKYGTVQLAGSKSIWPLNLKKAYSYISNRMVLIAEAAHGIHPIAGQGLNMSLRDIAALTELLDGVADPGDAEILTAYQRQRRGDNTSMAVATDLLDGLFRADIMPVRAARRFGLHAISKLPFAKKFFMKQAMGAIGNLPSLISRAQQDAA